MSDLSPECETKADVHRPLR